MGRCGDRAFGVAVAGASVSALEEIEHTRVGDAVAQGIVATLQAADLVALAQAGDVDGDVGQNRCQMLEVRC